MNLANYVVQYIGCFFEVLLSAYFFSSFKERRFSFKICAVIFTVVGILYGAFACFTQENFLLAFSILFTLAIAFCYQFRWFNAIFMALTFSVISILSELIVMWVISISGDNYEKSISELYIYLAGFFTSKMLVYLVTLLVRRKNHKSFTSIRGSGFAGLMTLPCSTIVISFVFSYMILHYKVHLLWGILSIVGILCLLFSNVMIFYIVDRQYELIHAREKIKTGKLLLESQRQYYEDIFHSQQEIRKTRHDLKNVFIALQGALNADDTSQAKKIILKKLEEMESYVAVSDDIDNMVDSILYAKIQEAKKLGVSLYIKKNTTRPIVLDQLDLCVLMANLLDNAIEAASQVEKNKQVHFSLVTDQDSLILLSQNSANHPVNDEMKTTKKDKKHHGFGMLSIKSITEKYQGSYHYEFENGMVTATVILLNQNG